MIKSRGICIFIFTCFLLTEISCKQVEKTSKDVVEDIPKFKIINAYTQKIIPGQQNQNPYIELGFEVVELENKITIDSVFCEIGKSININRSGKSKVKLQIESRLMDNFKFENAVFYYTKEGNSSFYELNEIETKNEVHLP